MQDKHGKHQFLDGTEFCSAIAWKADNETIRLCVNNLGLSRAILIVLNADDSLKEYKTLNELHSKNLKSIGEIYHPSIYKSPPSELTHSIGGDHRVPSTQSSIMTHIPDVSNFQYRILPGQQALIVLVCHEIEKVLRLETIVQHVVTANKDSSVNKASFLVDKAKPHARGSNLAAMVMPVTKAIRFIALLDGYGMNNIATRVSYTYYPTLRELIEKCPLLIMPATAEGLAIKVLENCTLAQAQAYLQSDYDQSTYHQLIKYDDVADDYYRLTQQSPDEVHRFKILLEEKS